MTCEKRALPRQSGLTGGDNSIGFSTAEEKCNASQCDFARNTRSVDKIIDFVSE